MAGDTVPWTTVVVTEDDEGGARKLREDSESSGDERDTHFRRRLSRRSPSVEQDVNMDEHEEGMIVERTASEYQNHQRPHNEFNEKKKNQRRKTDRKGIASDIAEKLKEPKYHLVNRVVQRIGEALSLSLLRQVLELDSHDGLVDAGAGVRRTRGGMFFYLFKTHPSITKEDRDFVFLEEKNRKRQFQKKKKQEKNKQLLQTVKQQLQTGALP
eukprot:GILK01008674.1.p1 GENE.GILK01008674.1~~GILK01008674.1.p1  ORF type:complete len:228 (-),score=28.47 GILK01008674.1:157-795(-)